MILAKDLSRLGRDHIGVGEHLEKIFPQMGLRFVAISEGYDTKFDEEPSADMVPIINFFNEFHAKSTSRKTKASKLAMAKAGEFQGSKAPFGYILDPEDKHHLLVDYDCGYALHFTQSGKHRQSPRYQCSLYNVKGKNYCRSHFITYNDLYKIVLDDVRSRARCAASLDSHVISRVQKEANSQLEKQRKKPKKDCEKLDERVEEIDKIIPKLYEDSTLGLISRECTMTMMTKK